MSSGAPSILVIIVTWNKKQYVLDLLASLTTIEYPVEKVDILVVDNASNDGTVAAIKASYPHVRLLCNQENIGGTGGFNTGLRWAFEQPLEQYRYLWLLDNDVVVHQRALLELVTLLEAKADIAIAGSTMMQLDYPWRINEMGAFVNRGNGQLVLNRHLEQIYVWQGRALSELLQTPADLSKQLMHCCEYMDVDYVAAASLLVRADIARQAGLWRDYFIHFDDVEWCLRIGESGQRIVVSAKSLIWHLSAAAKVPTWVLYYDNRNVLDLLKVHGANAPTLQRVIRRIYLKAAYYHLIGKTDLAQLHYDAIHDFQSGIFGKKNIQLAVNYQKPDTILSVLLNPKIKRILIAWTVNLQATQLQESIVKATLQRPELQVDFLTLPGGIPIFQVPRSRFIHMPKNLLRWKTYWQLRGQYDLVMQSDYQSSLGLSWLNADLLFVNDEGFCQRQKPLLSVGLRAIGKFLRHFWG